MSTVDFNGAYLLCGTIQVSTLLWIACQCLWIFNKNSIEKVFNADYISYIPTLLILIGIIQFSMGLVMVIYEFDYSDNFVFEGLALCQQASYFVIILLLGGIVPSIKQEYDKNKNKFKFLLVCSNE